MKRFALVAIVIAMLIVAYATGFKSGVNDVILNQSVWEVEETGYIEYRGEIHEYDAEV